MTRHGTYMPPAYTRWKQEVAAALVQLGLSSPIEKPFALEVLFCFKAKGIGDKDNLEGGILDAGNGVSWLDDKQAEAGITLIKRYHGKDEILFNVRPLPDGWTPDWYYRDLAARL